MSEPYLVWANLQDVEPGHESEFDSGRLLQKATTAGKLNLLAGEILGEARPTDRHLLGWRCLSDRRPDADLRKGLRLFELVAVRQTKRRLSTTSLLLRGRGQRVDAFHATGHVASVGSVAMVVSRPISGETSSGRSNDPGGVDTTIESNRLNLHPSVVRRLRRIVYHHGAGFRKPILASIWTVAPPASSRRKGSSVGGASPSHAGQRSTIDAGRNRSRRDGRANGCGVCPLRPKNDPPTSIQISSDQLN